VYPPISGPTPVKPTLEPSAVVTARATVDDNRTFSPPKDPAAVLSPQQALDAAWQHVGESGITDVRLVLSRTTTSIGGTEHDAWLVIFYGTCVQSEGPGPVVSPTPFTPPGPSCYREPTTEVIDAADGHWMFGFSGGNQADPWKLFVPDGL
jgi:hypothetical protein